jgi:hypothetical protein
VKLRLALEEYSWDCDEGLSNDHGTGIILPLELDVEE